MSFDLSEHDRQIANMIRIGVVTAVDLVNALVTVDAGGMDSDWLPWIAARAGSTSEWSPPTVGEQCVLLSPYGDMGQGVVMLGLYQTSQPAPSQNANQNVKQYPDGSTIIYDAATNTLTVNVAAAGNVIVNCVNSTVNASTQATINSPTTTLTGNAHIEGNLQVDGTTTSNGTLTYKAGLSGTGGGTISGDVTVNGIGVSTHHHTAQGSTSPTSTPQA